VTVSKDPVGNLAVDVDRSFTGCWADLSRSSVNGIAPTWRATVVRRADEEELQVIPLRSVWQDGDRACRIVQAIGRVESWWAPLSTSALTVGEADDGIVYGIVLWHPNGVIVITVGVCRCVVLLVRELIGRIQKETIALGDIWLECIFPAVIDVAPT